MDSDPATTGPAHGGTGSRPPVEDALGLVGRLVDGRYEVERAVARGGFGVVYRATHVGLGSAVALKVLTLPPHLRLDAGRLVERFRAEARLLATLQHPAIVRVLDVGSSEIEGTPFVWMALEWIDGVTLADDLRTRGGRGRSPRETLALLSSVFDAIASTHRRALVHRDLKPANLMLAGDASAGVAVRVLDFGIAKETLPEVTAASGMTHTTSETAAFSLDHAAPEQVSHARTGPWTDVHALGLLVTELVTGRTPYMGDDSFTLYGAILSPERPTPERAGVDVGPWEEVLRKALARIPAERHASAAELRDALAATVDEAQRAWDRPPTPATALGPPRAALPWLLAAAGVALVSVAVAVLPSRRVAPHRVESVAAARPAERPPVALPDAAASVASVAPVVSVAPVAPVVSRTPTVVGPAAVRPAPAAAATSPRARVPRHGAPIPVPPRRRRPTLARSWLSSKRVALAALAVALVAARAVALENAEEIVRRDLIRQAETARRAGDHETAVERATRAARLSTTPSLWYFLAREYQALGRPLDVLASADACVRGAEADPLLHNRARLLEECGGWVRWAEARIGRVTVRFVGERPPGASVRIADHRLVDAELGVPYPVLPGPLQIEADAPAFQRFQEQVAVPAGGSLDVEVKMVPTETAPLRPAPPSLSPPPPAPPPRPATEEEPATQVRGVGPSVADRRAPGAGPWIVGGAGLASVAASGLLYGLAVGAQGDRDRACPPAPGTCAPTAVDDDRSYRRYLVGADVALALGVAALATGALWWALARPRHGGTGLAPLAEGRRLGLAVTW